MGLIRERGLLDRRIINAKRIPGIIAVFKKPEDVINSL